MYDIKSIKTKEGNIFFENYDNYEAQSRETLRSEV